MIETDDKVGYALGKKVLLNNNEVKKSFILFCLKMKDNFANNLL